MQSAFGSALKMLIVGTGVVAVSFLITTKIVHKWSPPQDPNARLIHVLEATYGESCKTINGQPAGYVNLIRSGNATTLASLTCDNTNVVCPIIVDPVKLGDPAAGCSKDFIVKWRCGNEPTIQAVHLPPEAADEVAWVSCSVQ